MAVRELTLEEAEDARRLRQIWNERKEQLNLSQVKAAKQLGYSSQGAISQYLNGKVGLNFQAAAKFAQLLRVGVGEISPRYGKLVEKPQAPALDAYAAPVTGVLGGSPSTHPLNWFAFHRGFWQELGVPAEHLKLVRVNDESYKGLPSGSVVLVDDRRPAQPKDGVYLMEQGDALVAREIKVSDELVIRSGTGKDQRLSPDSFGMLRTIGQVIAVLTIVSKC
jgi:transcriptional regulator with XRE-family HTH domain